MKEVNERLWDGAEGCLRTFFHLQAVRGGRTRSKASLLNTACVDSSSVSQAVRALSYNELKSR
ncbi:hypothetical protein ACU8KH_01149 [Lachancea thermotolerans]